MKTAKRAFLLVLCAILLVIASVLGTMAYLTDTDSVKNTFTIGKVGLKLDEELVDLYGKSTGAGRTNLDDQDTENDGNKYKLISGHTYVKDPTVTVDANSEESYVRMIVTISDIEDVKAAFGKDETTGYFLPQYFVQGWDPAVWETTNVVVEDNGSATYEFRYFEKVSTVDGVTKTLDPLFDSFKVPEEVEKEELLELEEMEIIVEAHAIQADGLDNAGLAWAAFDAQ